MDKVGYARRVLSPLDSSLEHCYRHGNAARQEGGCAAGVHHPALLRREELDAQVAAGGGERPVRVRDHPLQLLAAPGRSLRVLHAQGKALFPIAGKLLLAISSIHWRSPCPCECLEWPHDDRHCPCAHLPAVVPGRISEDCTWTTMGRFPHEQGLESQCQLPWVRYVFSSV